MYIRCIVNEILTIRNARAHSQEDRMVVYIHLTTFRSVINREAVLNRKRVLSIENQ